jgi:hypothetical protein
MKINIPEGRECNHPLCGTTCHKPKKEKKVYTLKRTPIKKKPYTIKKVSDKMKGRLVIYQLKRKEFLKANPECQANLPWCTKKSTEIHHMKGRENELLNESAYWLAICRTCHRQVTEDTQMAFAKGLSISKHANNKE